MTRTSIALVLFVAACDFDMGDDGGPVDTTPPTVVSITPADGASGVWLHDPIRIVFSEALDLGSGHGATLSGPANEPIAAEASVAAENELTIRIDPGVALAGPVRLTLGAEITDVAGNPLAETTASWTISPWATAEVAGTTPSVVVDSSGQVIVARNVETQIGRRVAVRRWNGTAWEDLGGMLGARDAALPSLALGDGDTPIVVWSEFGSSTTPPSSVEAARWNGSIWQPLASPGEGSFAVAAGRPGAKPSIAYTAPSAQVNGTVVRVRVLEGDAWQPIAPPGFDIPVNGNVIGLPQLVLTGPATPALAFAESGGGLVPSQVRILKWTGPWTEVSPITLPPIPNSELARVAIAERNGELVVAYDAFSGSFGVHAVAVTGTTWRALGGELDVDPSANAQAPAIAIDEDGAPIVAWRELIDGNWRGVLARWNGSAWVALGGRVWSEDPARPIVRPALAMYRNRVPIVAWADITPRDPSATAVRVARFNGPRIAPLREMRASIAGCSFDGAAATLSATGCFTIGLGRAVPHPGLIAFDVTSELWSDGALKRRWIALPDGQMLTAPAVGAWTAPPGTMLVKEFAIETTPGDTRTRRVMETRFLIHRDATTWQGFSFRWRLDGNDANLLPDAASTFAWPLDGGNTHVHSYPSRAQCARCHHPSNGPLLGVRTAQLARKIDDSGVIVDQLAALGSLRVIPGLLGADGSFSSPHDISLSLETRVRGYLAANCSHCHNPSGERPTRDFRWETPLAQTKLCGPDSEVVQGNPAASVIVQRISTRTGGMPPIATLETDPLAIDIVTRWIATETSCE